MINVSKQPLVMLKEDAERESGRHVQLDNIEAARAINDIVRTCLGPNAMLKMLVDTMGGTIITSDGNAILRDVAVKHPAASSMIEISRALDQEAGDGTTSVIVLASEVLNIMEGFLKENVHPVTLMKSLRWVLDDVTAYCSEKLSKTIDVNQESELLPVIRSCLNTKVSSTWMEITVRMAVDAVRTVTIDRGHGLRDIDIKRFVRIEKVPGGCIEDSKIVQGVVLNKDVLHAKMRRSIDNPRVLLLDTSLEFHKMESNVAFHSVTPEGVSAMLAMEEKAIHDMCKSIIDQQPDLVFCEKGVSDLAQHYLMMANISVIRRIKKTDTDRLARVTGAVVVSDLDELTEDCIGTKATMFKVDKIGNEYFAFVTSNEAKACTLFLRGPSKDILSEFERNLQDALSVARNVFLNPKVIPGGGAGEAAIVQFLKTKADQIETEHQLAYRAAAMAFEIIPKTLIQNGGGDVMRQMTALRAKHAEPGNETIGINGETGELCDMRQLQIWDPFLVRIQVFKSAFETAILLLRIDDIISGVGKGSKEDNE